MIKNNFMLFKMVYKASPSYIIGIISKEILDAIILVAVLYINRVIINMLVGNNISLKSIILFCLLYIILDLLATQLKILLNNIFNSIKSIDVGLHLKNIIFKKINEFDVSCYENAEFYNDYTRAVNEIDNRAISVVQNIAAFCGHLFALVFIATVFNDIIYILCVFFVVIMYLVYISRLNKLNFKSSMETTSIQRKLGYISRIFWSKDFVQELRIFNLNTFFIKKNDEEWDKNICIEKKYHYKTFLSSIAYTILSHVVSFSLAVYVGFKIIRKDLLAGDFLFLINSFTALVNISTNLLEVFTNFKDNNLYITNINKILEYKPDIPININGKKIIEQDKMDFEICNLNFAYPNTPDVLVINNISLHIKSGTKLAIVGDNGSGKSTFIKLLMYLYKVEVGMITCNKYDYSDYNTALFRSNFGVVYQDFQIYAMSISENILMRKAKEEDYNIIWEALEFSGLDDVVRSLPKGIDTVLTKEFDSEGIYLSGGELQKLAISRAYARSCKTLIFDEPSSALDPIAEHEMFKRLLKLGKDKTVIYISHRLSSVVEADLIVVFNNGEIIERGNHKTLMNMNGKYYEMFSSQAEKYMI